MLLEHPLGLLCFFLFSLEHPLVLLKHPFGLLELPRARRVLLVLELEGVGVVALHGGKSMVHVPVEQKEKEGMPVMCVGRMGVCHV